MLKRIYMTLLIVVVLTPTNTFAASRAENIFDKASKYTVFIERVTKIPFEAGRAGYGTGSGFIIDKKKGIIATNAHVVSKGIGEIRVRLKNKNEYPAEVVYVDPKYDLAIIRFTTMPPANDVLEAKLGDSAKIKSGHQVGTFGNPYEFDFSASSGIISANDRTDNEQRFAGEFFQTDASINPGNSGGPLIDLVTGEVIGINTYRSLDSKGNPIPGLGFSLKTNVISDIIKVLLSGKQDPKVAWIGLRLRKISAQRVERHYGLKEVGFNRQPDHNEFLIVSSTLPDSPAEAAGFQQGDILLRLNRLTKIKSRELFEDELNRVVDKTAEFEVLRRGDKGFIKKIINVDVVNRNEDQVTRYLQVSGMVLHHITTKWRDEFGIPPVGAFVSYVRPGSPADLANFRSKDIVTAVDGQAITNIDDMLKALTTVRNKDGKVEIQIQRLYKLKPNRFFELDVHDPEILTVENNRN